ncbi:hypothetical protein A6R68_21804 [Neotoma lepida]|uniref:UPAR/Ly6 domain-containing protein n=1 Tax=Neotoma lepida TaxID=56216 RepID=A0A1A6HP11_NEOLE|nr:hypothetical protein A6R68_21804 [Neotoma lepida]
MAACCIQYFLPLFLLGASHWTCMFGERGETAGPQRVDLWREEVTPQRRAIDYFPLVFPVTQNLHCEVSRILRLEDDPGRTFNWTSKAERCYPRELCQETVLLIKAEGTKTVVLASKGCTDQEMESMTFIQYAPPPGLVAVSYINYCNNTLCNNRDSISQFWNPPETTGTWGTGRCEHQLLTGQEASAAQHVWLWGPVPVPPLCPVPTAQLSAIKEDLNSLEVKAPQGGMDSIVHVQGCATMLGCRLLATMTSVGPITVKETCNYHSFLQPRKAESGASWMLTSLWMLELLLPALLLPLTHLA